MNTNKEFVVGGVVSGHLGSRKKLSDLKRNQIAWVSS